MSIFNFGSSNIGGIKQAASGQMNNVSGKFKVEINEIADDLFDFTKKDIDESVSEDDLANKLEDLIAKLTDMLDAVKSAQDKGQTEETQNNKTDVEKDEYGNSIVTSSNLSSLVPAEILDMLTESQINSITRDHSKVVMKDNAIVCLDENGLVDEVFEFTKNDDGSYSYVDYVKSWGKNDTAMVSKAHGRSNMRGPEGQYVAHPVMLGTVAPKDWLNWIQGGSRGTGEVKLY